MNGTIPKHNQFNIDFSTNAGPLKNIGDFWVIWRSLKVRFGNPGGGESRVLGRERRTMGSHWNWCGFREPCFNRISPDFSLFLFFTPILLFFCFHLIQVHKLIKIWSNLEVSMQWMLYFLLLQIIIVKEAFRNSKYPWLKVFYEVPFLLCYMESDKCTRGCFNGKELGHTSVNLSCS